MKVQHDYPIIHHFGANAYVREMRIDTPGMAAITHAHAYDHLSYLAKGKAAVNCDGVVTEYTAPTMITIKQGVSHGILCVEPLIWLCIHGVPADLTEDEKVSNVEHVKEN
jgi:quercetin dioxygenase-like cupin family protein